MKIATGNMVNIPYTPPRTQLSVIELEDGIATSGDPTKVNIAITEDTKITASPFEPGESEELQFEDDILINY